MTEITDPKVKKILEQYERKRMREKERYERIKETEEFKNKNRERARNHYNLNKEVKKNNYMENRDLLNARSSYYYYKRNDRHVIKFIINFISLIKIYTCVYT